MQNFGTLQQFLNLPPLSPQICDSAGGRGVPNLFFLIGILIFMLLRSPCTNLKPYDNPFWDFSNSGEKSKNKSKKRLITKNRGLPKLLLWSHALRSDQNLQHQPSTLHKSVILFKSDSDYCTQRALEKRDNLSIS